MHTSIVFHAWLNVASDGSFRWFSVDCFCVCVRVMNIFFLISLCLVELILE